MDNTNLSLAERLTNLKKSHNITVDQWAELSGIPAQTIKRILSGATPTPSHLAVCSLVKSLDASLDDFGQDLLPVQEHTDMQSLSILERQINRQCKIIAILSIALAVILLTIIAVLLIDLFDPTIGFIRYQHLLDNSRAFSSTTSFFLFLTRR